MATKIKINNLNDYAYTKKYSVIKKQISISNQSNINTLKRTNYFKSHIKHFYTIFMYTMNVIFSLFWCLIKCWIFFWITLIFLKIIQNYYFDKLIFKLLTSHIDRWLKTKLLFFISILMINFFILSIKEFNLFINFKFKFISVSNTIIKYFICIIQCIFLYKIIQISGKIDFVKKFIIKQHIKLLSTSFIHTFVTNILIECILIYESFEIFWVLFELSFFFESFPMIRMIFSFTIIILLIIDLSLKMPNFYGKNIIIFIIATINCISLMSLQKVYDYFYQDVNNLMNKKEDVDNTLYTKLNIKKTLFNMPVYIFYLFVQNVHFINFIILAILEMIFVKFYQYFFIASRWFVFKLSNFFSFKEYMMIHIISLTLIYIIDTSILIFNPYQEYNSITLKICLYNLIVNLPTKKSYDSTLHRLSMLSKDRIKYHIIIFFIIFLTHILIRFLHVYIVIKDSIITRLCYTIVFIIINLINCMMLICKIYFLQQFIRFFWFIYLYYIIMYCLYILFIIMYSIILRITFSMNRLFNDQKQSIDQSYRNKSNLKQSTFIFIKKE